MTARATAAFTRSVFVGNANIRFPSTAQPPRGSGYASSCKTTRQTWQIPGGNGVTHKRGHHFVPRPEEPAKAGVSKDGHRPQRVAPSLRDAALRAAPQDEVVLSTNICRRSSS